jgi:hypothetical protein
MPVVTKRKVVKAGGWRTLESFWNATAEGFFIGPAGAEIKIRYGGGWPFGKDSQKQRLDGVKEKKLTVGKASLVYARMQMKVSQDAEVTYGIALPGP